MWVIERLGMLAAFVPALLAGLLSAYLARTSDDFWRVLAWVPVAPVAIDGLLIYVGVAFDPTSHNLWPIELFLASVCCLVLFGAFWLLRGWVEWTARRNQR
jgi:hypothetical protein